MRRGRGRNLPSSRSSPDPQGYLSVLHLKAVVYVSLDNSVLGELGNVTSWPLHGSTYAIDSLPEPVFPSPPFLQEMANFTPRPAPF